MTYDDTAKIWTAPRDQSTISTLTFLKKKMARRPNMRTRSSSRLGPHELSRDAMDRLAIRSGTRGGNW